MNVKIKNYSNRIDAEADKALLAAHGISSVVSADDAGGMRPDLMMSRGGVWLMVDNKHRDEATRLINEQQ